MNRAKNVVRSIPGRAPGGSNPPPAATGPRPQVKNHRNTHMCRTSKYMPPGSDKVGLTPNNQPSKVVWELDYGLSDTQFKQLSARFPGIAFVQTGIDCHDHPIAHTSYRVVWENVVKKIKPGSRVADVAGNPQYNEQFNRRQVGRDRPIQIDTFCKVLSPKDSVRAKTRWGPSVAQDGTVRWEDVTLYDMYRNEENQERFAQYDCFLFNHSLYYYTKAELTKLLNLNPDSVAYATIHKLPGQKGSINCGEQVYEKDLVTGSVVQSNVETGEEYEHPDPQPWFEKFCYADENGAIAWTINKGCDDTYVVTITSSQPNLVPEKCWAGGRIIFRNEFETVEVTLPVVADPPPAYSCEKVVFKTHDLLPGYHVDRIKEVTITHPELYEKLKNFMINKPRNHRTLSDLTNKAHREVGNNSLVTNAKKVKISAEALTEHVFAAWMSGVGHEADMFHAAVSSSSAFSSVNRNLTGRSTVISTGTVAKQFASYALKASAIVRSKDPVHQVLAHIDEML